MPITISEQQFEELKAKFADMVEKRESQSVAHVAVKAAQDNAVIAHNAAVDADNAVAAAEAVENLAIAKFSESAEAFDALFHGAFSQ